MVDRELVLKRIDLLEKRMNYLKGIEKFDKQEYSNDQDIYFRYERALHLAIEAVIDLGNHLIADQNFRTPESNRDIFKVLFENKIINNNLYSNLKNMAGFRNILVHDYLTLDRELEYEIIKNSLGDFRKFMEIVAEYI